MKKQILILFMAVFVLGANQAFGQDPFITPVPIPDECIDLDDPLNVVAGRSYTYTVNVETPPGDKYFRWFVTQDIQFIEDGGLYIDNGGTLQTTGGDILVSASGHYNDLSLEENSIDLTFQAFTLDPEDYVFVVVYVENDGTAEDGCITDNLKVYRIQPLHAFTLTVENIDFEGNAVVTSTFEVCVDDVQDAFFDPTFDDNAGGVVYDYGQNAFFYGVAAANFSGDFALAATFTGLQDATGAGDIDQEVEGVYWSTSLAELDPETGTPTSVSFNETEGYWDFGGIGATGNYTEADPYIIYIKVVVNHNQFEAAELDGYDYTFALDGVLAEGDGTTFGRHLDDNLLGDVDQLATDTECLQRNPFGLHNQAVQTLRPRPAVESNPAGLLLPNAP